MVGTVRWLHCTAVEELRHQGDEPRPARRRAWRYVFIAAGVALWVVGYLPFTWIALWSSGLFWSLSSTVVAVIVLLAPMAILAAFLCRSSRVLAVLVLGVGILGTGLATAASVGSTAPSAPYLAERLDEVGTPSDWVLVEEQDQSGNSICFDVCPRVCRTFRTPDPPTLSTVNRAMERFADAGFKPDSADLASETWPYRYGWAPHFEVIVSIERWTPPHSHEVLDVISVCMEGRETARV